MRQIQISDKEAQLLLNLLSALGQQVHIVGTDQEILDMLRMKQELIVKLTPEKKE
jgi:hypothetical protein